MNKSSIFFFILFFSLKVHASSEISTDNAIINEGKSLFENNCSVCHGVHDEIVGPALSNVYNRRDIPWIKSFIRNSQKVILSGDEYAVKLYEKYNQTQMTSFDFDDSQILSILAYIKNETDNPPQKSIESSSDIVAVGSSNSDFISNSYIFITGFALLIILSLIFFLLILLVNFLISFVRSKKNLNDLDKEILENDFGIKRFLKSIIFRRVVFYLFLSVFLKSIITGLFSIGVQQGYAPVQPIAFSHQIHAGQYQIDCQYCHTGVMKSKNANIPSLNICMNCHSNIKKDSSEIKKIYLAIENNIPIEWVRVHNLPKLAYFNHSQHVNVGGLECQDCHGPVEEMDVVYQYSPLTMGWCIDCHREKRINAKGNEYYDNLIQVHDTGNDHLKVKDIGGLECGKCHY